MSWSTDLSYEAAAQAESTDSLIEYLAEHYPDLKVPHEPLESWVRSAIAEDVEKLGLVMPYCESREEVISFFWESRGMVLRGYEELNQALEEDWEAFAFYRPLFPEVESDAALALAA